MLENFQIRAKDLPYSVKKDAIQSYIGKENIFHHELKFLLENIYTNSYVEILQGADEKGKDIVVRVKNNFGEYEHIAFVVKAVEKLSGSATSKTAELVIQIQQAFKTKAQLKDIHEEVTISKVYVINTGTISDGTKRNILSLIDETSYKNNLHFFAIGDLIKLFEEHYPEFYFNKDLQTFFKDRIEKIEKFLIEDKKLKYFIEPQIKRFNKTKNELLVQQNSENDLKLIGEQLFGHKETFLSFLELITEKKSKKIILTGEAGAGKSVLLFKIILEFINKFLKLNNINSIEEQSNFSLPICLKAIDIKNSNLDNFEQIIETFYSSSSDNTIRTIIIDGVDEVSKEDRLKIKEKVEAYIILKDKTITTVFSSRTNFTILEEFDKYIHYELMPYETKQAIEFIKKMASKQSILVENLEKSLMELEGQIPFYPLALRLLVEVVEKHNEIPASITELYNKYIGIMFGEFEISTEIDKLFEPRIKREFLSGLSYKMFFIENKVKINYQEFKDFVNIFCQKHAFIDDKDKFIENIERISILKIENNEVYFSHKSFLDFFIANYYKDNKEELVDEGNFDKLFSLYSFVEQWEEVVFFYFGLKNKINKSEYKKLKESIDSIEHDFDKNLNIFYLGRLVQYAWMTDSNFKEEIISNGMITSLDLKDNFHKIFTESLGMEIPHILSSISMFNMIDLCYSSSFLRNETKKLIENIDNNESKLYFATIYILKNSSSLGNEFINKSLKKIVPLIQNTKDLENKVLLTMLIDFFEQKGRIELDEDLDKNINKLIKKYKKRFPGIFKNILTIKKNGFKNLRQELTKH
jgi:hypothetical protein